MDLNFVHYTFAIFAFSMVFLSILINYLEPFLPIFVSRTFRYGKYATSVHHPIIAKLEVPKSWFKHYYVFAAPCATYGIILMLNTYFYNNKIPNNLLQLLDLFLGVSRKPLISTENALLGMTLLTIHCWKRFYETHRVSVFSDKKINIVHYIIGFIHYAGAIASILGESKGFCRDGQQVFHWYKFTFFHILCALIFLWSTFMQLRVNFALANLRTDSNRNVVFTGYKVPSGGLFQYISAPLQFTEIILYLILSIIFSQGITFHYVTLWVVANQVECALLTHEWYRQHFKNYPKDRKILIPYLY